MILAIAFAAQAAPFAVTGSPDTGLVYTAGPIAADALPALETAVADDARLRCGARQPSLGKFSYGQQVSRANVTTTVTGYRREIACRPTTAADVTPVAADWQAGPADDAAARAAATALFAAYDRGNAAAVAAMQDNEEAAAPPNSVADWPRRAGRGRRVVDRVTWYVNPASASKPGLYVALDWHAEYELLAVGCGYVVLYRTPLGFRVVRQETNVLRRADAPTPEQLARARAALPCG